MLTLRSRDDGRKGAGFGLGFGGLEGEMEENELEEGEACSGPEDDATVDPEIALSYIDEKIQDVLGHFKKDFEGGVRAANLGTKFDVYGSFLPVYQRLEAPSNLSHPKSLQRSTNYSISRSLNNSQLEGAFQNISISTSESVPFKNNGTSTHAFDDSGKKDACRSASTALEVGHQLDFSNRQSNENDLKTLKVRIKVGPENVMARNNAAIYSGLGLDISPSSSPEGSPDDSGGFSPGADGARDPLTIFQFYTCFHAPYIVTYLLSPISESLLHMVEQKMPHLKDCKMEDRTGIKNVKYPSVGSKKSSEKTAKPSESKGLNSNEGGNVVSTILKKDVDIETTAGEEMLSKALNFPISSKYVDETAERQFLNESVEGAGITKWFDKAAGKEKVDSGLMHEKPLDRTLAPKAGGRRADGLPLKGKVNLKRSSADKLTEDLSTDCHNDDSTYSSLKAKKNSTDKHGDFIRSDSEGYKARKDHVVGPEESVKLKSCQRDISHEHDEEKLLQVKDKSSLGKIFLKGSRSTDMPNMELKENSVAIAMVSSNESKKSLAPKDEPCEGKSNSMKSSKDPNRNFNRECLLTNARLIKGDGASRSDVFENISRSRSEDLKLDYAKDSLVLAEKVKDRTGSKKVENLIPPESLDKGTQNIPVGNCSASNMVTPPNPPVVIQENWVCCDKCQKWRLLPYGTETAHLPKRWRCSMLNWLPGMNKCNISEEETTRALHALYQLPPSEGQVGVNGYRDTTNSGITFVDPHLHPSYGPGHHTLTCIAEKKPLLKEAFNASGQLALTLPINSSKENQLTSTKSRSLSDVNQYPPESNLSNRTVLQYTSKSTNLVEEKQKHKHKEKKKLFDQYSDGGDFNEQIGKKLKSKSRREFSQDGEKAPKKTKTKASSYVDEDSLSNHDFGGRTPLSIADDLSTKMSGKNTSKKDYPSSKNSNKDTVVLEKKMKRSAEVSANGEVTEHVSFLDAENSGSVKKRKMKQWQKSQALQTSVQEETSDSVQRNSKTEGKELSTSKINPKPEGDCLVTGFSLSVSRDQLLNQVVENQGETGKVKQPRQRTTDCLDSSKRDFGYSQPSMAATSSSSKVSGSRKSKANFQEGRSSPVESVSSSPLRVFSNDKHCSRRSSKGKDGTTNIGYFMASPRRCSDGEVDGAYHQFDPNRKEKTVSTIHIGSLEINRLAESRVVNPITRGRNIQGREVNTKEKDLIFSTIFGGTDDEPSPSEYDANAGAAATLLSEQPNNYSNDFRGKNRDNDQEQHNNTCHTNGLNTQKTSSKSSSRSREKQKISKAEISKGKKKISSSYSDQEDLIPTKNDNYPRYEVTDISHGRSTYPEDLRQEKYNVLEKEQKNSSSKIGGKWLSEGKKDSYSDSGNQINAELNGSSMPVNKAVDLNSRVGESAAVSGNSGKPLFQENPHTPLLREDGKHSNRLLSERADKPESISVKGKLEPLTHVGDNKEDPQNQGPEAVALTVQGSQCETVSAEAGIGDPVNVLKQPRKFENKNKGSMRHPAPKGLDAHAAAPPKRGGSQSDANVLKEARDLKHKANNLKNEGLNNESTRLYFAAALKFLHVASLRELSNSESAKNGDMTPSINMYSDTAKLCEFCAVEYEKLKEMAAAALAYKCMEVAYMKVAYFKSIVAVKDRHEPQIAPQIGESPPSSASDGDNLNNHGILEKAALGKVVNSSQIAGNHVIAARNRPNFAPILTIAQDVNFAMEASRRSLNAFASARASIEDEQGAKGILSVRKVLDFGFHDIESLLRLVRFSIECIGC